MESFASTFIFIILLIPLYAALIWTYMEPEESLLFGKRWMYKEDPIPSTKAIHYAKFTSMTIMIGLPIVIISLLVNITILRLVPIVFFLVLIIGAVIIFTKADES